MAFLVLLSVSQLINTIESSQCSSKEFTETPKEVQNSCDSAANIENRWRGELSYTETETYIEVDWKKIVQDSACVKAMEFFVDGVKQEGAWGGHQESTRIDKIGEFSLKVEVYFLIPGTSGTCYGVPNECKCFEATMQLNVPEGDNGGDNGGRNGGTNNEEIKEGGSISPLTAAAASGGAILFFALLLTLAICIVKHRRKKEMRRLEKAEEEEMAANTDESNVYGIYATSNEESDYITVTDTNPDYEVNE